MRKKNQAFTLAEVVITLIVIGVVAAITIPMLHNDVNDKKWNVARQKAQSTIGEAFRLMTVNGEIDETKSTAEFTEKIIPKYLKLAKTCTISNAKNCGISTSTNFYKTPNGTKVTMSTEWTGLSQAYVFNGTSPINGGFNNRNTLKSRYNHSLQNNSYFFQTLDGFSVNFFYNPFCVSDKREKSPWFYPDNSIYGQYAMDTICFMGIYDMNGTAGPNKVGMDVGFVGSFYNGYQTETTAVLPYFTEKTGMGWNYSNNYCNGLGKNNDWILPDLNDMALLYLNSLLVRGTIDNSGYRWFTRMPVSYTDEIFVIDDTSKASTYGVRYTTYREYETNLNAFRCVHRTSLK